MANTSIFESMARIYDTPERVELARVSAEAIALALENERYETGLDFGCGTGLVGFELLTHFDTCIFLDSAPNMIEQVKTKALAFSKERIRTLCLDFETAAPSDIKVDCIFMAQVLLHIPDYEAVLDKLVQHLNPGGQLLIVDFNKNEKVNSDLVHAGFDTRALSRKIQNLGFHQVLTHTFYEGKNVFMKEDASLFLLSAIKTAKTK